MAQLPLDLSLIIPLAQSQTSLAVPGNQSVLQGDVEQGGPKNKAHEHQHHRVAQGDLRNEFVVFDFTSAVQIKKHRVGNHTLTWVNCSQKAEVKTCCKHAVFGIQNYLIIRSLILFLQIHCAFDEASKRRFVFLCISFC